MNKLSRRGAFCFLAVAGSVAVAQPADGAATDPPIGTVPDGYVRVVDPSGSIAMAVPEDWEVDTSADPVLGVQVPHIFGSFADLSIALSGLVYTPTDEMCRGGTECVPYDDGRLVGYRKSGEECCGGPLYETLVANPSDGRRATVALSMSYRDEAALAIFETVAATVEILREPYPADWVYSASELAPPLQPWPYPTFESVPQLGTEPVLGSGCGADGSIGDIIPDGLWAGTLTYHPDRDEWLVNLMCVYSGDAADRVLADGDAHVVTGDRDYLVVDNNPRTRTLPNAAISIGYSDPDYDTGVCVPSGALSWIEGSDGRFVPDLDEFETYFSGRQGWIRVYNGAVVWIHFGCDTAAPPPGG